MTGYPAQPPDFGAYPTKPLSIFERQAEAKRLREEAGKLVAEAERLEEGCRLELKLFDDKIAEALAKMRNKDA